MNRNDKISAYMTNSMTAEDLEQFEMELLTNGSLQTEIEEHFALKRGLTAVYQEDITDHEPSPSLSSVPPALLNPTTPIVYVETMRGAETLVQIFEEPTQLSIDVGPSSSFPFEVQLKSDQTTLVSETIDADEEGYVNLIVPKLPEGQYHCELVSSQISKTLLLSVVKK